MTGDIMQKSAKNIVSKNSWIQIKGYLIEFVEHDLTYLQIQNTTDTLRETKIVCYLPTK